VHAKSNAYPTTMLLLMKKKIAREKITIVNERERKKNGTSRTQAKA
jgi:hypothetical protein